MASEFMVETNQNQDGAKPDETSSSSEGLLEQIQMFMSEEQKARLYKNNNLQQPANSRPAISAVKPTIPPILNDNSSVKPPEKIENIAIKETALPEPNVANYAGDRRSQAQSASRSIGRVTCCTGSKVIISSTTDHENMMDEESWSIGQMISISTAHGRVVCMITEMRTEIGHWREEAINSIIILADIFGEVNETNHGTSFKRGVTKFPPVGAIAHRIRFKDLECIYDLGNKKSIDVGTLSQNQHIAASVGVDDILGRHVAIMGTTGVGKSCAVGLVVSRVIEAEPNLRVVMLDPHDEFASAFGDKANNLDQNSLELPYWLLNFDELIDVVFKGNINDDEIEILQEFVVQAKQERQAQMQSVGTSNGHNGIIVVDTPVPYRMSDVIKYIEETLGHLEPKFGRQALKSLRTRLEILENNPRYSFMFARGGREENFSKIIGHIFRLPANGKPMTTINLAGLPGEVINCVAAVIARLSFDVARASQGAIKVLLVCEEAHRYVPKERELGFIPTRLAISRIAKEGRKYGCSVAIITQRPGELDPTILSQCSTVFAMRLTNDYDQSIIKAAISDSSGSIISFMSALDNREAIAFGEGVSVPMRLRFDDHDLAKLRNKALENIVVKKPKSADEISAQDLVVNIHGIQQQIINKGDAVSSNNIGNAASSENPIRPGMIRPSLLKKDVLEILAKHEKPEPKKIESPRPVMPAGKPTTVSGTQLRKDLW